MLKSYLLPENAYSVLYRDFLNSLPQAVRFLGRHYSEAGVFAEKAQEVCDSFAGDRGRLVAMLSNFNRGLDCSAETLVQIGKLNDPQTVAVISGQQAGLLGGPLYTVYKAIAAVKLARDLEGKLGRPVVPVFWIASEDHDFSEANHCWMLDRDNRPQRIDLELEHMGQPVGMLPLTEDAGINVLERLTSLTMETDFTPDLLTMLDETRAFSQTPADWFARIMAKLFAGEGLVMFDPLIPEAREMLAPFYMKAAKEIDTARETLQSRETALRAAGYPLQVERDPDTSLFMFVGGKRAALYYKDGYYTTRDGVVNYNQEELLELAEKSPESLSPNVLLRPLAQDSLFPTVAYIPGPGELAYFAQVTSLYPVLGQTAPLLYPRPGLTVVEPRLARYMKRYEIAENQLLSDMDECLRRELRKKTDVDLDSVFEHLRQHLAVEYEHLKRDLARLSGQLAELTETNLQHVYAEISYLEDKAQQEARDKNEVVVRHFANLEQTLRPLGKLQERVFNIFVFQMKYGRDFWRQLVDEFPAAPGHYLFYYQPGKEN
ncbi:MAG: bacillithiol biosynthesis cysteine-adding enzyme BshC [Clostridiales bacterium]|jgi:bacillithiol biosynthesis cysteine-adding enzyme BshC|nr:bacillithiol biosynthesis cysteine-adding enzyme BshC [Clostridiales bacterium]